MKKLSIILLSLYLSANLFAGDVANFVNLGFSPNGNYFLFGEYGIVSNVQKAYANMWLVDVKRNSFVKGGVYSGEYETVIEPGESSLGSLLKLLGKGYHKTSQFKIDHLDQGRPLYVRINDDNNVDELNFRDFTSGLKYDVRLNKSIRKVGETTYSSFGISLETVDKKGNINRYSIGNPSYERKGVKDYKVERILHSSNGRNLVVVLSKYIISADDINVRYMVETISLK